MHNHANIRFFNESKIPVAQNGEILDAIERYSSLNAAILKPGIIFNRFWSDDIVYAKYTGGQIIEGINANIFCKFAEI